MWLSYENKSGYQTRIKSGYHTGIRWLSYEDKGGYHTGIRWLSYADKSGYQTRIKLVIIRE